VIRVLVVDDHHVTRYGVEHLLASDADLEVVASVATLDGAVAALDQGVDVVVLDLYLGVPEPALDAVARLSAAHRVLVMSASASRPDVLAALRSGADGYLTKDTDDAEFLDGVRTVAGGGFCLSSSVADVLEAHLETQPVPGPELSAREAEALGWIARGFTHAQTAQRMGISASTVDSYVERIRRKLGLGNKAELTAKAIELRLAARDETS
jgi:DNA-binding NarL/FixJ family response regulator